MQQQIDDYGQVTANQERTSDNADTREYQGWDGQGDRLSTCEGNKEDGAGSVTVAKETIDGLRLIP